MKKMQYVVYSVGFAAEHDYNFIVSSDFLPENVWDRFKKQIVGSVRTENISDSFNNPRWLFSRYNGYSLWGMSTNNYRVASEEKFAKDYVGRGGQQLRVFIGMVCEGEFQHLPNDLDFFKTAYKELIEPNWELKGDDPSYFQVGKEVVDTFENYEVICPHKYVELNHDNSKVRFLGNGKSLFEYMASALAYEGDVSCMGTVKVGHKNFASKDEYHFNNVIVESQIEDEEVNTQKETQRQSQRQKGTEQSSKINNSSGSQFNGQQDPSDDFREDRGNHKKKSSGLSKKVMASVVVLVLLLVLMVVLLLKKR